MSSSPDEAAVRTEVELILPALEQSTDDELLAAIGSIPLTPMFTAVQEPQAYLGFGVEGFGLARVGEAFVRANRRVRAAVCSNKDDIEPLIEAGNVTSLVVLILPALGVTGIGAPPAAAIALAVFLLRKGLDEYCEEHEETEQE